MIYFSTTTLNKEVKKGLLNNQYSNEEVRGIYNEYLLVRGKKMKGIKTAIITSIFIILFNGIAGLTRSGMGVGFIMLQMIFMSFIFVGILLVVYYMQIGMFSQQVKKAMKPHYSHILEEMSEK